MTFLGDEGRDVMVVRKMITEGDITFLGPTASVGGFFLGPIYYYFMVPFLWLFGMDPVGPAIMVALFGVATIYLVFYAGCLFFNKAAGYIAAVLYTLSPLVIAHSRSSWNPNIVPFFSLLYIVSLYNAVKTNSMRWYFTVGFCVGVGLQLHYLFTFLIPCGVVYILLYARGKKYINYYLAAVVGAIVPLLPFLAFEVKNRFPNTVTIFNFVTAGKEVSAGGNPFTVLTDVVYRLFARLIFVFPPPEQISIHPFDYYWMWRFIIWILIGGSLGVLIYWVYKKREPKTVLILLWFACGVGLFSFYQKAIYDYYLVIMFALPFLLLANLFSYSLRNTYIRFLVLFIVGYLVWVNWQARPFVHQPNNQIGNVERIAGEIFDATGGEAYNFALLTSGNSDHAYRYFLEIWNHPPTVIYNPEIDPARHSVTDQLVVLCEYATCQPLGNPLWEVAGFGPAEIVTEKDIGLGMKVFRLVHVKPQMLQ